MAENKEHSLVKKFASRFGIDANKLLGTLMATAFRQRDGQVPSTEQLVALLVVADQYNLNPFTKEIYAYPDKQNGIIPVVSVDGWVRIANEHPQFDGIDFRYSEEMFEPAKGVKLHEWVEAIIYRKDRQHPICVREYAEEVHRQPILVKKRDGSGSYEVQTPWQSHGKRMHRHKALIQGLRIAFGFAGIYDQDEAERIIEGETAELIDQANPPRQLPAASGTGGLKAKLGINAAAEQGEAVPA